MQDPILHAVTVEKRRKTKFEKYGDPNWNNAELAMQTRRENNGGLLWTDEMKQKQKRPLLERYGDENWNNQEKKRQTCLEKYGVVSYSQTDEFIEKTKATNLAHRGVEFPGQCEKCREKQKQTSLEKYGTEYYVQSKEYRVLWKDPAFVENRQQKQYETKRKNHSFKTSKQEDSIFKLLCEKFSAENVIRQYRDKNRYPFHCDFYIKSADLFIECNFHWTHCGHFFNAADKNDIAYVRELKQNADRIRAKNNTIKRNLYDNAIEVWTVRDPNKIKAATNNHLNYVTLWTYDEAVTWIANKR